MKLEDLFVGLLAVAALLLIQPSKAELAYRRIMREQPLPRRSIPQEYIN
jgi:hypothetical protein